MTPMTEKIPTGPLTSREQGKETTKLTLQLWHGTYSVEVNRTDLALNDLMEDVVVPALLGAGYSQKTIDDYFLVDRPGQQE